MNPLYYSFIEKLEKLDNPDATCKIQFLSCSLISTPPTFISFSLFIGKNNASYNSFANSDSLLDI